MAKNQEDDCICPLFGRAIYDPECYEAAREAFNREKTNEICEKCRRYVVNAAGA